jgi:hypothetical protein
MTGVESRYFLRINGHPQLREDPVRVGDMVLYRGRLSRVESLELEERYCWLLNDDGDTYLVPQWDSDLQNYFERVLAEARRAEFFS